MCDLSVVVLSLAFEFVELKPSATADGSDKSVGADGADSGPNRSEFIKAIGRAPIVKTSLRIPPTPVAAP